MNKKISAKLAKLEKQIDDGVVGIRTALLEIHDKKLYGECFEAYCKDRWGFSRQHGYNIIKAARAALQVSKKVDTSGMKTSHLLAIADAPQSKQADVACEVLIACEEENRKATGKDYKQAVRAVLPKPAPKPKTHQREPGDESEPTGEEPVNDWKTDRSKAVKTSAALQRAIDDLNEAKPNDMAQVLIDQVQDVEKKIKGWK